MNKVFTYEFDMTGAIVEYKKINSIGLQLDIRKMLEPKRPQPPVEKVNMGGVETDYENKQHPEYLEAVKLWLQEINDVYAHMAVDMSVQQIVEPEDWRERTESYIKRVNKYMPDGGQPLEIEEDEMMIFFIERIASGTNDGLKDFYSAIQASSAATDEGVKQVTESFRPNDGSGRNGTAVRRKNDLQPAQDQTVAGKL